RLETLAISSPRLREESLAGLLEQGLHGRLGGGERNVRRVNLQVVHLRRPLRRAEQITCWRAFEVHGQHVGERLSRRDPAARGRRRVATGRTSLVGRLLRERRVEL